MKRILLTLLAVLLLAFPAWAGSQSTSGQTVQNILDIARSELNDNASTFVSDTEMVKWVNQASIAITAQARCLEFTETVTLATEAMEYSLTTNAYYDIETVYIDSGVVGNKDRWVPLEKVDPASLYGRPKTSGIPSCWYDFAGRINVWPVPSSEANGYSLVVSGIARPTIISATTDSIQTPFYFDASYVDYIMAKYWTKDKKYDRAAYFMSRFENALIRYRMEVRRPLVYVEGK